MSNQFEAQFRNLTGILNEYTTEPTSTDSERDSQEYRSPSGSETPMNTCVAGAAHDCNTGDPFVNKTHQLAHRLDAVGDLLDKATKVLLGAVAVIEAGVKFTDTVRRRKKY